MYSSTDIKFQKTGKTNIKVLKLGQWFLPLWEKVVTGKEHEGALGGSNVLLLAGYTSVLTL